MTETCDSTKNWESETGGVVVASQSANDYDNRV